MKLLVLLNLQHRHNLTELQVEKEQIGPVGRLREPHPQLNWVQVSVAPITHSPTELSRWSKSLVSDCWVKETSCQADWGNVHIRIPPSLPPSSHLSFTWEDPALLADSKTLPTTGTKADYFGMSTGAAQLLSFSSQMFLIRVLMHCSHHNIYTKASNTQNNVLNKIWGIFVARKYWSSWWALIKPEDI